MHHDNFDLWDSVHQPWNYVNIGPRRGIVEGWRAAAERRDMRFGLAFHGDYALWWFQVGREGDREAGRDRRERDRERHKDRQKQKEKQKQRGREGQKQIDRDKDRDSKWSDARPPAALRRE
jgi:alpha-L-fucosidase